MLFALVTMKTIRDLLNFETEREKLKEKGFKGSWVSYLRGSVVFSILGMYLFGGKFCTLADGSRECNCQEIVNKAPNCICDRKHFNNMLWATVTVFQVHNKKETKYTCT